MKSWTILFSKFLSLSILKTRSVSTPFSEKSSGAICISSRHACNCSRNSSLIVCTSSVCFDSWAFKREFHFPLIVKKGDVYTLTNNVKYKRDNFIKVDTEHLIYDNINKIAQNNKPFKSILFHINHY